MEIAEKIKQTDSKVVQVFKEGVFWVAYEQSAFFFWKQRGYRATKKWVKAVKREIVSVGFPQNALDGFLRTGSSIWLLETDETNWKTFRLAEAIDEAAFEQWKERLEVEERNLRNSTILRNSRNLEPSDFFESLESFDSFDSVPTPAPTPTLEQRLRAFPLADSTPMECMLFLSKIQKELLNS